jgi:hypothetical protein
VRGQGRYLRWFDDGGVGGDDDADDGEWLSAVRAAVLSTWCRDVVRERSRDGRDGGDGERDDVTAAGVVAVSFAPGGFAAVVVAEPFA